MIKPNKTTLTILNGAMLWTLAQAVYGDSRQSMVPIDFDAAVMTMASSASATNGFAMTPAFVDQILGIEFPAPAKENKERAEWIWKADKRPIEYRVFMFEARRA